MSTQPDLLARVAELIQQLQFVQTEDRQRIEALFEVYIQSIARLVSDAAV
jgi:hypothetical protein